MTFPDSHSSRPDISLIIPALNEEGNLTSLIQRILEILKENALHAEILIVDDCSGDGTLAEARVLEKQFPEVRALHKPLPHGLGRGVRFGIDHANGRMGVVIMADGVDPLSTIVDFKRAIIDQGAHLALLSRYLNPGDAESIPWSYKTFQYLFRWISFLLVGVRLKDTTYAYRAFDIDYVRALNLRGDGFEISPEITFAVFLTGGRITEVRGQQTRRVNGMSKFLFRYAAVGYSLVLFTAFSRRFLQVFLNRPGRQGWLF